MRPWVMAAAHRERQVPGRLPKRQQTRWDMAAVIQAAAVVWTQRVATPMRRHCRPGPETMVARRREAILREAINLRAERRRWDTARAQIQWVRCQRRDPGITVVTAVKTL